MAYKVIQWATGNVGQHALRAIIQHPDLELVGLWAHSEAKAGRDAGELAGLKANGIIATTSIDEVLALNADVVCYTANADVRPFEALEDLIKIAQSGKNIISTSLPFLTYPPQADPGFTQGLADACKASGVSAFTSGIDPGFGNDLLPLTLMSVCEKIDSLRVLEILNYSTYDQAVTLFDIMAFGKPMDEEPLLLMPGNLSFAWGGVIQMLADAAGAELQEIKEIHECAPAPWDFEMALGKIEKGSRAAMRFELQGIIDGRPAIIIEHVSRLHQDICPEWPQGEGGNGYRIEIEGSPKIHLDMHLEGADGDHNTGGLLASAMRVLHAIPQVIEAEPGLISTLDLVRVNGKHVF